MNIFSALFAMFVLVAPASAQDSGSGHWDARLTAVTGEVLVHPAGGGDEVDGEAGLPLEEGDRVTTAPGASAEIALDGASLIAVRESSDFTLENTQKSASIFSLSLGSILAKIQKLGSQNLSVRSPSSVAAVRGTEFAVDVELGASHVGVFDEGRVEVQGLTGRTTVLTPSQETSVVRGDAAQPAAPLSRFAGRRALMRAHILRLTSVRLGWKALGTARRREARSAALKRLRQRRLNRLQKRGGHPDRGNQEREEREKRRDEPHRESK